MLSVGEKGIFRMKLRTHGKAGHASLPRIGDNALLKLAGYLAALSEQPPPEPTDVGEALLEALIGEPFSGEEGVRAGLERLRAEQPLLADYLVEPMLGVTLTPTKAEGGKKANVIPSEAEALIDCRVPPGFGREEAPRAARGTDRRGRLRGRVHRGRGRQQLPDRLAARRRDPRLARRRRSGAEIAPIVMPGFSDSNPFRTAFPDAVVYGFCPYREVGLLHAAPLIHGADERVPVSDVEFSARFFYELPLRMLA